MSDTSLPAGAAAGEAPAATTPAPAAPGRGWSLLAPLFLVLLSIGVYAPTLKFPLVYDDFFLIGNSSTMTPVSTSFLSAFKLFGKEYWDGVNPDQPDALRTRGQALYRPLTLFTWACIVAAEGGATPAWPFHALSLALNALVVLLLYLFVRRLFGAPRTAFAAALLFALHPLHSEAVAYVAGLSDVLAAVAVLLGLLLWERATREPGRLSMPAYFWLMATFFLGLLAKEQAAVLPAAVFLTDLMLGLRGDNRKGWPRVAVYAGFVLLLAVHVGIRLKAVGYLQPSASAISALDNPLIHEPFPVRLINGVKLLAFQLWLFLWPVKLSIDYSFNSIPTSRSWSQAEPLAAAVLVVLLLVYGLVMLRRRPALGWGVLFFLGVAVFTSNILVAIGTLFGERLTYLPSAGLCLALAAAADGLLRDRRVQGSRDGLSALGLVLLVAAGGLLGTRTWEHNRDFASSEKLFEAAEAVVPNSARVHFQLGALLGNQQLYTKSEEHYTRALAIDPTFIQAAMGLGDVYLIGKNWVKAIDVYDRILQQLTTTRGDSPEAINEVTRMVYTNRARARAGKGDSDGAASDLRAAMQLSGGQGSGGMGPYLEFAQLAINRGKAADAVPVLRQALTLHKDNIEALYLLARAATITQDVESYDQAVAGLESTEKGKPLGLAMRGEVMYEQADAANDEAGRNKALSMLQQVRELRPDLATPYVYRGSYLLHVGRYADAIVQLDLGLQRSARLPLALRLKAAAQLMLGKPQDALVTEQELELIKPDAECYKLEYRTQFELGNQDEMQAAAAKLKDMGTDPVATILDVSVDLEQAGRRDDAIGIVESGLLLPDSQENPDLLRNLGTLLTDAGRFDEALAVFDRQEAAEAAAVDRERDHFLPINRARCLMGLDQDVKAAAQLELFEQDVVPESQSWVSLAHRRAQLFLKKHGPYYNPRAAADLADQGLAIVKQHFPDLLDISIEALAAARDFAAAQKRAQEAVAIYPAIKRYGLAEAAFKLAADGDLPGALAALRKPNDPVLNRIAGQLEG